MTQGRSGLPTPVGILMLCASTLCGCAGPQPLAKAIDPKDEADFRQLAGGPDANPRKGHLRAKAAALGVTYEKAEALDGAISATVNPFNARRDRSAVSRGAVIYRNECSACHGEDADGRGSALPTPVPSIDFHRTSLRMDMTMHGGPVKKWFGIIHNGSVAHVRRADGTQIDVQMPAFKERLSREQTWLVITYLQSFDADAASSRAEPAR